MIEATIIGYLSGATAAGTRVFTGARIAGSALPALVVRVTNAEVAALGDKTTTLKVYDFEVLAVATQMTSAQSLVDDAVSEIITAAGSDLSAGGCHLVSLGLLDDPDITEGDDQNFAVCTATMRLYHYA